MKKLKVHHEAATGAESMDSILAKLTEQTELMQKQGEALSTQASQGAAPLNHGDEATVNANTFRGTTDHASISSSLPITPATDSFISGGPNPRPASASLREPGTSDEVLRLKLELAHYKNKVASLERERQGSEQNLNSAGTPSPSANLGLDAGTTRPGINFQGSTNTLGPAPGGYQVQDGTWAPPDETRQEGGDTMSASGFGRSRAIWSNKGPFQPNYGANPLPGPDQSQWMGRAFNQGGYIEGVTSYGTSRLTPDHDAMRHAVVGRRASRYENRYGHQNSYNNGFGGYGGSSHFDSMNMSVSSGGSPMGMYPPYQPQPSGTQLSPHAPEFTSSSNPGWKNEVCMQYQIFLFFNTAGFGSFFFFVLLF